MLIRVNIDINVGNGFKNFQTYQFGRHVLRFLFFILFLENELFSLLRIVVRLGLVCVWWTSSADERSVLSAEPAQVNVCCFMLFQLRSTPRRSVSRLRHNGRTSSTANPLRRDSDACKPVKCEACKRTARFEWNAEGPSAYRSPANRLRRAPAAERRSTSPWDWQPSPWRRPANRPSAGRGSFGCRCENSPLRRRRRTRRRRLRQEQPAKMLRSRSSRFYRRRRLATCACTCWRWQSVEADANKAGSCDVVRSGWADCSARTRVCDDLDAIDGNRRRRRWKRGTRTDSSSNWQRPLRQILLHASVSIDTCNIPVNKFVDTAFNAWVGQPTRLFWVVWSSEIHMSFS